MVQYLLKIYTYENSITVATMNLLSIEKRDSYIKYEFDKRINAVASCCGSAHNQDEVTTLFVEGLSPYIPQSSPIYWEE